MPQRPRTTAACFGGHSPSALLAQNRHTSASELRLREEFQPAAAERKKPQKEPSVLKLYLSTYHVAAMLTNPLVAKFSATASGISHLNPPHVWRIVHAFRYRGSFQVSG